MLLHYGICRVVAGRFCEWKFKSYDRSSEMETFNAFFDSLKLSCEEKGKAEVLNWTVAEETPDLVYYQVNSVDDIFTIFSSRDIIEIFSYVIIS